MSDTQAFLSSGTVQSYAARYTPFWMCHFGRCQYDTRLPILTDSLKQQAQPIIDRLNKGEITTEQAEKELGKLWV